MKKLLYILVALFLCACENEKPKEVAVQTTNVVKRQQNVSEESHSARKYQYDSSEGFLFGTSYEDAKRYLENVGRIQERKENKRRPRDKQINCSVRGEIDGILVKRMDFFFNNKGLYGVRANVSPRGVEEKLVTKFGEPARMEVDKLFWVINKNGSTRLLSYYYAIDYAELIDGGLDKSDGHYIEYIEIEQ